MGKGLALAGISEARLRADILLYVRHFAISNGNVEDHSSLYGLFVALIFPVATPMTDKLTRERLISEGMYPDQTLRVKGLPWGKDEFKEIPIKNLVKKVLCRHHDSTISYVDQVGANTINAFREASRVRDRRAQIGPRRWSIERVEIDGYGLERWCLKMLVNFAAEGAHKIGRDSSADGQPSTSVELDTSQTLFLPREPSSRISIQLDARND